MTQKHENQKIGYNSYGSYICECTQPRDSLGGRSFGGDPHGRPPFNPPRLDHWMPNTWPMHVYTIMVSTTGCITCTRTNN